MTRITLFTTEGPIKAVVTLHGRTDVDSSELRFSHRVTEYPEGWSRMMAWTCIRHAILDGRARLGKEGS